MAKALTVKTLENLKPSAERLEVPDGLVRGLYFILQPSGRAGWAVRYRRQRQTRKLTIGTYPAIDLKAARELASRALVKVAEGADPAADKQAAKEAEAAPTRADLVENVVDRFIERYAKANSPRTWETTRRTLVNDVVAKWKGRRLGTITRGDVHELLDSVVDRGSPIQANRLLAAFRRMCNWAVERDIIPSSPCAGVKPPSTENSRDRVLSDAELQKIWQACETIGWPFGQVVRLLVLTGQRLNEVGGMRWSEIDLDKKLWTLPKARVKNGVEHTVPLSVQSLAVLKTVPRFAESDYVFTTTGDTAVSGFGRAKDRLDAVLSVTLPEMAQWTYHDFRRSLASGCARLGINLPVIEKLLNHVSGSFGGIVGVYQRHSFADEKRAAMDIWGRHVESVTDYAAVENVIELKGCAVMSARPTDESEMIKLLRHQSKVVDVASKDDYFDPIEFSLLKSSADGVAWGVKHLAVIIPQLSPADQANAYAAVCQVLRGSELLGAIAIKSKSVARAIQIQQARKATKGRRQITGEKETIAARYATRCIAEALELTNSDLKKRHLKPISRATLYRYRSLNSKQ